MQQKNNLLKISIRLLGLMIVGFYGCVESNTERNFFPLFKAKYNDQRIDSESYFIKGLGLDSQVQRIDNKHYWKLKCEKESMFYLSGFLRLKHDSIMILPLDGANSIQDSEGKLFDFSASENESWLFLMDTKGNMLYGDSVISSGRQIINNETVYSYKIYPFYFFKKNKSKSYFDYFFKVVVSKEKGIVNIDMLDSSKSDTLFSSILFPAEKFVDKRTTGEIRL